MHFNPYGGAAAQIAAELVNLGDAADPATLTAIFRDRMTVAAVQDHEATEIIAWTKRLRRVFEADPATRVDLVNALLHDSASKPYISTHDGKAPHLHYVDAQAGTAPRVKAYTAGGLAHLVCDAPDRFGVCSREGCETVYVDISRNGRRRFCSTRCATRVHVADHRTRQAS
ncbi:CGNR zinc finger domain-containing protein [Amycolatopsis sp. NPDC102389]|uniref:CGNR zinc finger domain-containing protein n=1 Tax=Amycolatopsis sp. NPDC102389 TaxID=3363941 RepID=UPI0038166C83